MTAHSALMAKRGWCALSACSKQEYLFIHTAEKKRKGRSELPELMWCLRELEKENVEKQEERKMKRRKFELEVEEKRRQAEWEMEERRWEAERKHEERMNYMFMNFMKEVMKGQAPLIPQLEDTLQIVLAQAHIPIQQDILLIFMGQDLINLPHTQDRHWTIQWTFMIPPIPSMTTITLTSKATY